MPRIPTYDNLTTTPTAPGVTPMQGSVGPNAGQIQAQQGQELATGLQRVGDAGTRIATDEQNMFNQVQVNDATNKLRMAAQDLAYNKDTGYLTLKGQNALTRPGGVALPDEYLGKLQEQAGQIAGGLGTESQRRQFAQISGDLQAQFHGQVEGHMVQQFMAHADTVDDSTMNLAENDAKLNWNNPDRVFGRVDADGAVIGGALDAIKGAAMNKARRNGLQGAPAEAAMLAATSNAYKGVILAALENKRPDIAQAYLDRGTKAHGMTADDILSVKAHVDQQTWLGQAQTAVQSATTDVMPTIAPTSFDRMVKITLSSESNGQRYDPKTGGLLTSPAGAKGEMQVLDGTNLNPGFGVKPAKDNSPEERARVGRDYLQAMLQRYGGDPAKAWAAYNWGPGKLDKLLTDQSRNRAGTQGADWISYLPKATRDYVAKNTAQLQGSGGQAPRPTELDFVNTALAKLPPNAPPQLVQTTREQATQQFTIVNRSLNEMGNNALTEAQRWLAQNQGDMANMPAPLRDAVDRYAPGKSDDLVKYSKVFSEGVTKSDPVLLNRLYAHPSEMYAMSDAQFESLRSSLAPHDFATFAKDRGNYLNGQADNSFGKVNGSAMRAGVNESLAGLNIPTNPKPGDQAAQQRLAGIRSFVHDSLLDAQRAAGKQFTEDETRAHIDTLFAKSVGFRNTLWGTTHSENLMGMKLDDLPSGAAEGLRVALVKQGNKNPTDTDVLNLYRKIHAK
jgi:soluble lytic murein transglycosylase